jgi:hypothetical protein
MSFICSFTVNGFLAKLVKKLHPSAYSQRPNRTNVKTHLLRYLAIGSAGFDLISFKNPEKLKAGSPAIVVGSLSVRSRSRSLPLLGVEGPGTGVSSVPAPSTSFAFGCVGAGAGVANGSNSDKSGPVGMGVAADKGV